MKNERLEELSDKVRMGIPVDIAEVFEVIEYQEMLRKNKPFSWWRKLWEEIKYIQARIKL